MLSRDLRKSFYIIIHFFEGQGADKQAILYAHKFCFIFDLVITAISYFSTIILFCLIKLLLLYSLAFFVLKKTVALFACLLFIE